MKSGSGRSLRYIFSRPATACMSASATCTNALWLSERRTRKVASISCQTKREKTGHSSDKTFWTYMFLFSHCNFAISIWTYTRNYFALITNFMYPDLRVRWARVFSISSLPFYGYTKAKHMDINGYIITQREKKREFRGGTSSIRYSLLSKASLSLRTSDVAPDKR